MSNTVFPSLPGLAWGVSRKPKWSSRVQKSTSGKRQAMSYMSFPLYEWTLSFNVLREYSTNTDLEQIQGFFNAMKGQYDTFLYADPHDAIIPTNQLLGLGNGSNKNFQLVRSYGGVVEPIFSPAIVTIRVNNVVQTLGTHYTITDYGVVQFVTAPGAGVTVTATGTFRFRCAFTVDSIEFINSDGLDIWKSGKITFESVKP